MSEFAKEVFARIPEARRDAALREADELCRHVYNRAWQDNVGNSEEKARVATAAEDAARAIVFARFAEPVSKTRAEEMNDAYGRIPSSQRLEAERAADKAGNVAWATAFKLPGTPNTVAEQAEHEARIAVFRSFAEPAPFAGSHGIFMRIPEQCRAAARKEANTMGNDAWQARYDNTRGDLAAAAQAEEAARAKVFSRYAAPVEAGPTISDVKAALNRIPKERRIDAMRLANTETADVYRDAFRAADGDMAAKVRAGSAAERAARIAVFEKYAAQAVGESVIDAIEARVNSHTGMAARMDCAWLIGEVKRLRTELDASKDQLLEAATSIDVLREKCYDANTELVRTRAELQRWKRERCMSPAVGPWSADGARVIGRGNRIVAHTSSQSSPNPDAVQDAHTIAAMLNHAEAQASLDAFDAAWERVRIAAERAHQALSQFSETQAPEATELRAALDSLTIRVAAPAAPSPAWERLRVVAERVAQTICDYAPVHADDAREFRAALDAVTGKPATAVDAPKLGRDTFEPKPRDIECECLSVGPRTSAADHDDACPVYLSHAAKPSDAWSRVVHVEGRGYDTSVLICGREWSPCQCDAIRWSRKAARARANMFRESGSVARVIRLRPRAK